MSWLEQIKGTVEGHPIFFLRFSGDEWEGLLESRRGPTEFTIARAHGLVESVRVPTMCLIAGEGPNEKELYLGAVVSRQPITTLESRLKIIRAFPIQPTSVEELQQLLPSGRLRSGFLRRIGKRTQLAILSPKLSSALVETIASITPNEPSLRKLALWLTPREDVSTNESLQQDAVRMALVAFGLSADSPAVSLELSDDDSSALVQVRVTEDGVIEHDARNVPGLRLVSSDVTGRALFAKGDELLEVFTANRRPLEHVFGVDLIYWNRVHQNLVMLQYKMLEPEGDSSSSSGDWVYRPDANFEREFERMEKFCSNKIVGSAEYRLNPEVFYFKFVKRVLPVSGTLIIPIEHLRLLIHDPECLGPRGGVRVGFQTLSGRYLRESPFLDLVRAGYIGSHTEATSQFLALIEAVLTGDRAVVAAVQSARVRPEIRRMGQDPSSFL